MSELSNLAKIIIIGKMQYNHNVSEASYNYNNAFS